MLPLHELIICLAIGFAGGLLGGFLGIGGSLVMIPALSISLGERQHLYQASAMVVNLFVSLSALIRHLRAKVVRVDAFLRMAPAALCMIFLGVWASNQFEGSQLARVFSIFLLYVVLVNLRKIAIQIKRKGIGWNLPKYSPNSGKDRPGNVTTPRSVFIGAVMGVMAGLLGIGGGGIAVPMQQVVFRTPLRQCIGTSTAVICITSGFGAVYKNLTLAGTGYEFWSQSFPIIIALVPGAIVGAYLGAALTHKLPTLWVRVAFVLLLIVAGMKMSGLMPMIL